MQDADFTVGDKRKRVADTPQHESDEAPPERRVTVPNRRERRKMMRPWVHPQWHGFRARSPHAARKSNG